MKASFFATSALLSAAGVSAQYYNISSAPFALIARTDNTTYNNTVFIPCHEGAAIEGFCAGYAEITPYAALSFNTSVYQQNDGTGLLTWILHGGNFNASQPMVFSYSPATNLAHPQLFGSYDGQLVGFNAKDELYVPVYLDDTVTPPTDSTQRNLTRWYICETNISGYVYPTLNWLLGNSKPENPSCVKTEVIRQFLEDRSIVA